MFKREIYIWIYLSIGCRFTSICPRSETTQGEISVFVTDILQAVRKLEVGRGLGP